MFSVSPLWIPLALVSGLFSAAMMLTNQYFKVPGLLLVILSRGFIILALLPAAFFIDWPDASIYYIAVAMTGIFAGLGDIRMFNTTAKLGGGVVSRLIPLLVPVSFVSWFILQPSDLLPYMETPVRSLGILLTLGSCVFFATRLQTKCHISREGMRLMAPVILAYGVNGALAKMAMNNANLFIGVYGYMVIQSSAAIIVSSGYYFLQGKQLDIPVSIHSHIGKKLLLAMAIIGTVWISHIAFKISSFTFIDNPAYPSAVMLLSPLWVMLFYKSIGHKEKANISAGIGILVSTIFLVLLTAG